MNLDLRNIYLVGISGVGKTTVGKLLANHLKWGFIDFNEILEAIFKRPINEINDTFEFNALKNIEENILQELSQGEHQIFACNSDIVIDSSKLKLMDSTGIVIWLDSPASDLLKRIESRELEVKGKNISEKILKEMIKDRKRYYSKANIRIPTDKLTPKKTLETIIKILNDL